MRDEYKNYNKVTVTLTSPSQGSYTISKINTQGVPSEKSGCHLESISIDAPIVSIGSPTNIGANGQVVLIDYQDSVFKFLSGHLQGYLDPNTETGLMTPAPANKELLPQISITIECYTNTFIVKGWVVNWTMQFSGTTPSINLTFNAICPSDAPPIDTGDIKPGEWTSVSALGEALNKSYGSDGVEFVLIDGSSEFKNSQAMSKLEFITSVVTYDVSGQPTCSGKLIDGYAFICSHATLDGQVIKGEIDQVNPQRYLVTIKDSEHASVKTENSSLIKKLVFVQNGKFSAYESWGDSIVIPMTSFSFETGFNKLPLQNRSRVNLNGGLSVGNNGTSTIQDGSSNSNNQLSASQDPSSGAVTISFECYNVMCFDRNNLESKINFRVFNEVGKEAVISGQATVTKCSYTLTDAVIKANITATQVFNSLDMQDNSPESSLLTTSTVADSIYNTAANAVSNAVSSSAQGNYLLTPDANRLPVSVDKTKLLFNNGIFQKHVDEFLNKFGRLTGASRYISSDFVKSLISAGDFGLLTIILGVANYGISNPDPKWKIDAVNYNPDFRNKKLFCASNMGKAPFDYKVGGLGIAHWDTSNYYNIYSTIGFPQDITQSERNHLANLLVLDGSISGWTDIVYCGESRKAPKFNTSKPKMRLFDDDKKDPSIKGVKRDPLWLKWANDILNYKKDGTYIYQHYLFKLWLIKFWYPTVDGLAKRNGSIQDAVRISRAGNSFASLINASVGKDVVAQYELYEGDKERYVRQKCFCRRCADIIGYELS